MTERAHFGPKQGSWVSAGMPRRAGNGDNQIMVFMPVGASRKLRWGCLSLAAAVAFLAAATEPADARKRKRHYVKRTPGRRKLQPALRRHRGRRQDRRGAAPGGPGRRAPSGLAHQDHDALHAVRASGSRQDHARHADAGLGGGREPGADQARAAAGQHAPRRGRHQGPRHQVRQRRLRRHRRGARRQRRRIRADDDAQGAARIGMRNTVYRNASGLPNDEQITTARDQALLGIAVQQRFPKYYRYFSLSSLRLSRQGASAITTSCSARSKASTASRPATPAPPASIS